MQYDVVIIGGGLTGLQTALNLGVHKMRVAVIDKSPISDITNADFDGRTCAIALASSNLMKASGIWDTLSPYACPMTNIDIEDGDIIKGKSLFSMQYDCDLVGVDALGYIIENNITRTVQYNALQKMDTVDYFADSTVESIVRTSENVKITLNDGVNIVGSVLIGCDGRSSMVRENAGIDIVKSSYNQTAIVCTIQCEKPHNGLAVELFLPSGPFAMLPMMGSRMSIVWSERSDLIEGFLAMNAEDFAYHLGKRCGDRFGVVSVVDDARYSYPMGIHHAKKYSDTRLALVGDAAHGLHPIAGQGLNMGLRDVAAIVECLVLAKREGRDIGSDSVLQDYERYRYADNTTLLAITDGLTRLFSNNNSALRLMRTLGLGAMNKIIPMKKVFIKHAMGTAGTHIPKLLKGEDI